MSEINGFLIKMELSQIVSPEKWLFAQNACVCLYLCRYQFAFLFLKFSLKTLKQEHVP